MAYFAGFTTPFSRWLCNSLNNKERNAGGLTVASGLRLCLLTVIVGVLSACSGSLKPDSADSSGQDRDLLFIGHDDGDLDIYVSNIQTGETRKLTQNDRDDMHATWSPDGRQIAYATSEFGTYEIAVMNADGSNVRRLTNDDVLDQAPHWSPDGKQLVYMSTIDGVEQLKKYDFRSNTFSQLTHGNAAVFAASFSSDGKHIAYIESDGKKQHLKVFNADGSDPRQLTDDLAVISLVWSPDNSQIAFSARTHDQTNLYLLDVSDGTVSQLTDSPFNDVSPLWLPGGDQLVFLSARDLHDKVQVYMMNVADRSVTRLSNSGLAEMNLTLSPDGKRLAYVRFENRFFHTYVMDLNNRNTKKIAAELNKTQLTPQFRPAG